MPCAGGPGSGGLERLDPVAELLGQLHANLQDVFNENGVQIMSPHYMGDPERAKIVPRGEWDPPLAAKG